ncbi:MAG: site-specific integrase [Proteobacteria bacterium]|nr:site-specific integrase [Pseudomonadota bacterium]
MRISLTKKIVAALQPKDRPYELRDAQVRGLILRVQPTGRKVWIVTWAHGKRRTLGSTEHLSLDHVRDAARKVIAEFIQSGLPSIAKPELPRTTLGQFVLDHYMPWARSELKGAEDILKRLEQAFPKFLTKPLAEIDPQAIEQWWAARLKDKVRPDAEATVSKATATRNLATLSSILSKAVKWKMLEENPIPKARLKLAKSRSVVRFLSSAEETRLRNALNVRDRVLASARASANTWRKVRKYPQLPDIPAGSYASHLTPVVLLAMNTGLRRGELLSLDWSDINLDAKMLTVRRENAKSGKQRHIPLNAEALAVLKQWRSQVEGRGQVFGIQSLSSSWESLLTAAKIGNFRFHDMRHHFASRLVMAGVDLNTVRELLGHADLTMTLRYAHLAPEHLAAAVEKLATLGQPNT